MIRVVEVVSIPVGRNIPQGIVFINRNLGSGIYLLRSFLGKGCKMNDDDDDNGAMAMIL